MHMRKSRSAWQWRVSSLGLHSHSLLSQDILPSESRSGYCRVPALLTQPAMLFAACFSLMLLENIQGRALWKELLQGNNQCLTKTIPIGAPACIFLLCCALLSFQCDISTTEGSSDCVIWKLMFSRPLSSLLRAQMFSFHDRGLWPWPTPTDNWQWWLQSQGVISGCKEWQTRQQMMVLDSRQKKKVVNNLLSQMVRGWKCSRAGAESC